MRPDAMKGGNQRGDKAKDAAYYRLHTQAVEDLVSARADNTPQYTKEELEKYRSPGKKRRLPPALKAALIKAWFYGAVCFFVFWGLGLYAADMLDLYVVAGIVMGMVTDLLINPCLRFADKSAACDGRYILIGIRGVPGFFLHVLYGFLLLFLVVTLYSVINMALRALGGGGERALFLGVEPFLFGFFTMGADMLIIGCKRMMSGMIADARRG